MRWAYGGFGLGLEIVPLGEDGAGAGELQGLGRARHVAALVDVAAVRGDQGHLPQDLAGPQPPRSLAKWLRTSSNERTSTLKISVASRVTRRPLFRDTR